MNPDIFPARLSAALRVWRVEPPADPRFRAGVWSRLQRRVPATWPAYVRGHLAGWAVAAGIAVVAAGWGGHQLAQLRLEAQREQMVVSYLGGLDPRVQAQLQGTRR